ncbi:MAG: phosphoribosylamine--glycine ligase [Cyclonatronaceae bacterium]
MEPQRINVLLIGSGGREHSIARALHQSPSLNKLFIAPGNPGTASLGENVKLDPDDHMGVLDFVEANAIGLTVIGPEKPLVEGLVDMLEEYGHSVFGPTAAAAQLEGSKSFAKDIMQKYKIPTAAGISFERHEWSKAEAYLQENTVWPIVLKADGLAAGKGVFICQNKEEASNALEYLHNDPALSAAAYRLVVEEFLQGEEVSVFALCDGDTAKILAHAQDHKRAGDGDTGLNTGGMGAYSPTPVLSEAQLEDIRDEIIFPVVNALAQEGMPYKGVLYCGLMMVEGKPKVIEFNCRFGDPECQVILPALQTDIIELFMACVHQKLEYVRVKMDTEHYYTGVVIASGGYPRSYEKGKLIQGLPLDSQQIQVYHAGTRFRENGELETSGGRVLCVVGRGKTLSDAIRHAYDAVSQISFEGMYYRKDIGAKGLRYF